MDSESINKNEPTSYQAEAEKYVKRSNLLWQVALFTIPFDFLTLFLPSPVQKEHDVNYYLIFVTMLIVVLTANHKLVLQGIIFTKKAKQYITAHQRAISWIGSIISLAIVILFYHYSVTSKDDSVLKYIYIFIFYGGTIFSLVFAILSKEKISEKKTDYVIPLERIFYLCGARIVLPRILSLWAAFLYITGSIPQNHFLFYSAIALLVLCQAQPSMENYLHKCRSCGKEVLYGSGERGCCQECSATINITIPKFVLPKPQNPLKKSDKVKIKIPAIVTKILDYEIIKPIGINPNQKEVSLIKLITAKLAGTKKKSDKDGENVNQSETKLA